jgi:DNA-binding MarR family transcriptional regulator
VCQPGQVAPDQQLAGAIAPRVKGAKRVLTASTVRHVQRAGFPFLRVAHTQALENLDRDGTRLTVLAERAGISHQSMSELVLELVERGVLERVADPSDGRARLIRPTATGIALLGEARRHLEAVCERWEAALDGVSVAQVLDALEIFAGICADED